MEKNNKNKYYDKEEVVNGKKIKRVRSDLTDKEFLEFYKKNKGKMFIKDEG